MIHIAERSTLLNENGTKSEVVLLEEHPLGRFLVLYYHKCIYLRIHCVFVCALLFHERPAIDSGEESVPRRYTATHFPYFQKQPRQPEPNRLFWSNDACGHYSNCRLILYCSERIVLYCSFVLDCIRYEASLRRDSHIVLIYSEEHTSYIVICI